VALPVNLGAVQLAGEIGDIKAECNGHINATRDYLALVEPDRAWQHLQQAEVRCGPSATDDMARRQVNAGR
jgi:hypothetical protein